MSEQLDRNVCEEFNELEKYYTVFAGSSLEDVSYAKIFWNSATLQPPLESRLVWVDISQRLKIAKNAPEQCIPDLRQLSPNTEKERGLQEVFQMQWAEEKQKYYEMIHNLTNEPSTVEVFSRKRDSDFNGSQANGKAKKRDEIMALLKKQREERIKKEMVSFPYKPKKCEKSLASEKLSEEVRQEVENVRSLP